VCLAGSVQRRACGRRSASWALAAFSEAGLRAPSMTSVGVASDTHGSAARGVPVNQPFIAAWSYGSVWATAVSWRQIGRASRSIAMAGAGAPTPWRMKYSAARSRSPSASSLRSFSPKSGGGTCASWLTTNGGS
jgi:hypothetical protein